LEKLLHTTEEAKKERKKGSELNSALVANYPTTHRVEAISENTDG
jgi:hypothetical protein